MMLSAGSWYELRKGKNKQYLELDTTLACRLECFGSSTLSPVLADQSHRTAVYLSLTPQERSRNMTLG